MSARIPPDDPRRMTREEMEENLRRRYEEVEREVREHFGGSPPVYQDLVGVQPTAVVAQPSQSSFAGWLTTVLQGITLAAIVGFAFWLGSLSTTVSNTSQKVDKLNDAVVGVSRESLSNRLIAIETKLDAIDKRMEAERAPTQRTGNPSTPR